MSCRHLVILVALAGCSLEENYPPSLTVSIGPDGTGTSVTVQYERGTGHDFSDLHGTINGLDLGPADISEGGDEDPGQFFGGGPSPSIATWRIDAAKVGASAHVVVDDGGDELVDDQTFGTH